jgi:hypothetical protein
MMLRIALLAAAMIAAGAPQMARAQAAPSPPYYAMDPQSPGAPSGNSPVQQQIIENYRTQLQQTQRSLSQQDPSGTSRAQLDINRQLNQYNTAPPTPFSPAPLSSPPIAPPRPAYRPAYNPAFGR